MTNKRLMCGMLLLSVVVIAIIGTIFRFELDMSENIKYRSLFLLCSSFIVQVNTREEYGNEYNYSLHKERTRNKDNNFAFPYSEQVNIYTQKLMLFTIDNGECLKSAEKDVSLKFDEYKNIDIIGIYRRIRIELRPKEMVLLYIRNTSKITPKSGLYPIVVDELSDSNRHVDENSIIYRDLSETRFKPNYKLPISILNEFDGYMNGGSGRIVFFIYDGIWYVYEGNNYYSPIRIGLNMEHLGIFLYTDIVQSIHYVPVKEVTRERSIIDNLGSDRKKKLDGNASSRNDEEYRVLNGLLFEFISRRSLLNYGEKEQDEMIDMYSRQIVILREKIENDLRHERIGRLKQTNNLLDCNDCNDVFKCPNCNIEIFPTQKEIEFNSVYYLQQKGFWLEDMIIRQNYGLFNTTFIDRVGSNNYNKNVDFNGKNSNGGSINSGDYSMEKYMLNNYSSTFNHNSSFALDKLNSVRVTENEKEEEGENMGDKNKMSGNNDVGNYLDSFVEENKKEMSDRATSKIGLSSQENSKNSVSALGSVKDMELDLTFDSKFQTVENSESESVFESKGAFEEKSVLGSKIYKSMPSRKGLKSKMSYTEGFGSTLDEEPEPSSSGEGERSHSPSSKREKSHSPSSKREKSNSPSSKREKSHSPSSKREKSHSPSSKREKSHSPSSKREKSHSPSSKREKSHSPSSKREKSHSPSSKREKSHSPSSKRDISVSPKEIYESVVYSEGSESLPYKKGSNSASKSNSNPKIQGNKSSIENDTISNQYYYREDENMDQGIINNIVKLRGPQMHTMKVYDIESKVLFWRNVNNKQLSKEINDKTIALFIGESSMVKSLNRNNDEEIGDS
ncbi:hypothetical protein FG386_003295 [Cryptosporidium ryanae]|uniref:uncharacterized protein n=1 Tax=Cryptosporidium ryanae TaxID=515981 RepID=UPI003519E7BA|nr:hypothetical protein FG386_003295 [Cryptosporidium ryanae]